MYLDNNTINTFDRFILASSFKRIESRYSMAKLRELISYIPSYNIASGDNTYIISNNQTKEIQQYTFGLKGFNTILPFIRAEGNRNPNNDLYYTGSKAIFLQPGFNKIIRTQRCLVLADAFVVGLEIGNPYLAYLRGKQRPFSFAGIWNKTIDEESGAAVYSFGIMTCPANSFLQSLGMKRMPVILQNEYESTWLRNSAQLFEILDMLYPYPNDLMNGYPISTKIADKSLNDQSVIKPLWKPLYNEYQIFKKNPRLGVTKREGSQITLAERAKKDRD